MKFTKNNFFTNTYCIFRGAPLREIKGRTINFKSESGSSYYYTKTGVYRLSNHWGRAATCTWKLISEIPAEIKDLRLGFAAWEDFKKINLVDEDSFYVHVDMENNIVDYRHKDDPDYDQKAFIRSKEETRKVIRNIKNLLQSDKWATYYFYNNINTFRQEIIRSLINTNKSIDEIKREFINK